MQQPDAAHFGTRGAAACSQPRPVRPRVTDCHRLVSYLHVGQERRHDYSTDTIGQLTSGPGASKVAAIAVVRFATELKSASS